MAYPGIPVAAVRQSGDVRVGSGARAGLRVVTWAVGSGIAAAGIGGAVATLAAADAQPGASGVDLFPVWGSAGWWTATLCQILVLIVVVRRRRPSASRFLFGVAGAGVTYVVLGSALTTVGTIGTGDLEVAGSGWGAAAEGAAVYSVVVWGNAITALVVPLGLGLLPVFRPVTTGRPVTWWNPAYSSADEDAAAEDFNIY